MKLRPFKAIAAIDEHRGLGRDGDLPWHIPEDLKHFARTTRETRDPTRRNAVVMGRKTCESIPDRFWPLKGRANVVITANPRFSREGARTAPQLEVGIAQVQDEVETVYVVGGGQIYNLALDLPACEELILTRVHKAFDCDAFFPRFDDRFHLVDTFHEGQVDGLRYTFERWRRNEN